ncbi:hypothetical protein ACJX0J_040398, partial [Zea mays]
TRNISLEGRIKQYKILNQPTRQEQMTKKNPLNFVLICFRIAFLLFVPLWANASLHNFSILLIFFIAYRIQSSSEIKMNSRSSSVYIILYTAIGFLRLQEKTWVKKLYTNSKLRHGSFGVAQIPLPLASCITIDKFHLHAGLKGSNRVKPLFAWD